MRAKQKNLAFKIKSNQQNGMYKQKPGNGMEVIV